MGEFTATANGITITQPAPDQRIQAMIAEWARHAPAVDLGDGTFSTFEDWSAAERGEYGLRALLKAGEARAISWRRSRLEAENQAAIEAQIDQEFGEEI